jgi:hypothetical protein
MSPPVHAASPEFGILEISLLRPTDCPPELSSLGGIIFSGRRTWKHPHIAPNNNAQGSRQQTAGILGRFVYFALNNQRNTAGKASIRSEAIKLYSDFSWAVISPAKPWM